MRMAAYCRVSTEKEEQLSSLENQREFFEQYADKEGDTLVKIYADEGISGKSMNKREAFTQLLEDSQTGAFDYVAVKDISRFARNTSDFLYGIRTLRSNGVDVRFLSNNQTVIGESEFVLTVFAALAQEESSNLSKRVIFGKRQNAKKGRVPNVVYGYNKIDTYTLGKIAGANNSNLPVGNTYENNAYTRYLKEILNIQNADVFELQDGNTYEEAVNVAIEDRDIPDVLVVKGRDNLLRLIEAGMIEDLTETYEECTTDTIKEMYDSYGDSLLQSATVDGKLYAFPNTVIDDGAPLLWLRKDWIEKLGLKEPETVEEALEIVRAFVEQDAAGDGQTIGLACSTDVIAGADQTYGVDSAFIHTGAMPCHWILDESGDVVYGSVTQETKEALSKLRNLYEDGILDQRFLLRKTENIDNLLKTGHCGAIYGRWWAPNNPLSAAYSVDSNAEWKPYLLDKEQVNETQKISVFESYDQWMYVVVRKGYEHPEIVAKYVSAIFDQSRYANDASARELNDYFSINVDPTARPLNINVDYEDALYRTTEHIQAALDKTLDASELSGLEKSYYDTCKSFLNGQLTTANGWAAYASRIEAVGELQKAGIRSAQTMPLENVNAEIPQELQELENKAFLQIISGEKPVDYFDTFVVEWYANGGKELTEQVQNAYESGKD